WVRGRLSARRVVAATHAAWTQHDLPELVATHAEHGRRTTEVVAPHAPEPLVVVRRKLRPCGIEILAPRDQGAVVVGAEVVPVLDHEQALHRARDLACR